MCNVKRNGEGRTEVEHDVGMVAELGENLNLSQLLLDLLALQRFRDEKVLIEERGAAGRESRRRGSWRFWEIRGRISCDGWSC